MRTARGLPWLYVAPAIIFLLAFLVYPAVDTLRISFLGRNAQGYVGLDNYIYAFTSPEMHVAFRNNFIYWLIFATGFVVLGGLIIAVLADLVRYESIFKSIIFLPQAISFVGAGVIWRFVYDFRPQLGVINAVLDGLLPNYRPIGWLVNPRTATAALILIFIWMWTGFAMVILSAALKGIPKEILEAARTDGANAWQTFWYIQVPMVASTIGVVTTTVIIFVLKVFDLVYVMTAGRYDTNVMANQMYRELYVIRHFGRSSAIAVILLLAITPMMFINIRRFREQEALR
ncbi:MAG TPA: sugar ABC transporter permease [Chloroflexi bacterium]|jgi:alpha-glucoside transport system permease protein|nr:sugar ABC transporter permease [Chloroflexota bacterium]